MNVAGSEQQGSSRQAILRVMVLAALAAGVGGCGYRIHESDGVATIRFTTSTLATVSAGAIAAVVVAAVVVYVRGIENPKATLIIGGTVLAVLAIVPGIWMDTVTVGPDGVTQRTGFWFAPTVKGFRFDEVSELSIERRQVKRRRGPDTRNIWVLRRRDGSTREIDPGDLWEQATPYIIGKMRERGIRVN